MVSRAMRVFVTGATGVIGRRAVPLLGEAGYGVTAIGRTPENRAALERAGANAVDVDLFAPEAVRRALRGHEAVVNLATHIPHASMRLLLPGAWRENDRLRRVASAILVDAAIRESVEVFVQESFAPIYADGGEELIDESSSIQPVRYNRTTVDAEQSAERFTRSGGRGIVLRFAGFYGPDAFQVLDMIKLIRRGWAPLPGSPSAFFSSISHDDAATAVVEALDLRAGIYNVTDDEPVRRREYVDLLAGALGVGPPKFPPEWLIRLTGSMGELMARSQRMSNRKLRAACRWAPRYPSVREGWPAVVEALHRSAEATAAAA